MTSALFSRPTSVAALRFLLAFLLSWAISAFAANEGDATFANQAKNLARLNCGAQIEFVGPNGQVSRVTPGTSSNSETAALVGEDNTLGCALPQGDSKLIIALPKSATVDRLTFINENAAARGHVTIAVSNYRLPADNPKWVPVEGSIQFSSKRLFDLSLLGVEAKFVRLSFHLEKEGRIAAIGLYGSRRLSDYAERHDHIVRAVHLLRSPERGQSYTYNFANLYARAHVVRVSSGLPEGASKMIDDDPATSFQFNPADPHPTAVIELAETQQIHRVSALYNMQPGRLDVYASESATVDLDHLDALKPLASVVDSQGEGKAAVDFNPQGAHYIVLRWTPSRRRTGHAFSVAEVHAFGDVALALVDLEEAPQATVASSNSSATMAEPPIETPVSP